MVNRHPVKELRDLLSSKGLDISGSKPDLVNRVMNAVIAFNVVDDNAQPEAAETPPPPVPVEPTDEETTQQLEDMCEYQRT